MEDLTSFLRVFKAHDRPCKYAYPAIATIIVTLKNTGIRLSYFKPLALFITATRRLEKFKDVSA